MEKDIKEDSFQNSVFLLMVLILALTASAFYFNWSHRQVRLVALKTEIQNELEEQSLRLKQFEQDKLLQVDPKKIIQETENLYDLEMKYFEKLPLNFISTPLSDANFPTEKSFDVVPLFYHTFFKPKTIPRSQLNNKVEKSHDLIKKFETDQALPVLRDIFTQRVYNRERALHQMEAGFQILQHRSDEEPLVELVMFYLLYQDQNSYLFESQKIYYKEKIKDIIQYHDNKLNKAIAMWEKSNTIKKILADKEKPYYTMLSNNQLLTYSKNSMISISNLSEVENLFKNKQVGVSITQTKPKDLPEFMITLSLPGLYLIANQSRFLDRTHYIHRDYWVLNFIILLFLAAGSFIVQRAYKAILHEKNLATLKSKFVATVSHELRTPLSLIQLYSETLSHGRVDEDQKETYQKTILSELHRINSMVNNIVEHSKFENSKFKLNLKEQNLSDCCKEVIQVFQHRLQLEDYRIELDLEENVLCAFDWQIMSQVLYNLIDNAIKYSSEEKIIEIELKSTQRKVYLSVSDYGIGIPNESKDKIFQEYYRVENDHVFAQRGTGIGLALVHKMVTLSDGRIQVSDHHPRGTTFKLSFPNPNQQNHENSRS